MVCFSTMRLALRLVHSEQTILLLHYSFDEWPVFVAMVRRIERYITDGDLLGAKLQVNEAGSPFISHQGNYVRIEDDDEDLPNVA